MANYSLCSLATETTFHALRECSDIRDLWESIFGWIRKDFPNIYTFSDHVNLLGIIIKMWNSLLQWQGLYVTVKNKIWIKEASLPTGKVLEVARNLLLEFQHRPLLLVEKSRQVDSKWKPPAINGFKANYNGAIFEDSFEARIGVLARNERGEVIVALSEKISQPSLVQILEALAMRRTTKFIVELGSRHFVFEGNL